MFLSRINNVETPFGCGKLIYYNKSKQEVVIEMHWQYLVKFDAKDCFICIRKNKEQVSTVPINTKNNPDFGLMG